MPINSNELLEAALKYSRRDLSVIPIKGIAYALGDTDEEKAKDSKKPLIPWQKYQERLPTQEEIRGWWKKYPDANVAIITGSISDLAVIDLDSKAAADFAKENNFKSTPTVKTGRDEGYHSYYKYKVGIGNQVNINNLKLDIRGEGGYVIAPPSVHYSGQKYSWIKSRKLDDTPLADLPTIINGGSNNKKSYEEIRNGSGIGSRNNDLTSYVGALISRCKTYQKVLAEALRVNEKNNPPLTEKEVRNVVDSIYKKDQKNKNITHEQPESWTDPLPLPGELKPVSSLNPDLIPEPFRNWIRDISERMQCPIDYVAVAAIIEVATIVGARCVIFPKEKDNWEVTPNLWGCIVGPPSQLKTPAANETFLPSKRLILKSRETFENETQKYEVEKTLLEIKKEELKQKMKKAVYKDGNITTIENLKDELQKLTIDGSKPPQEKRYKVNDATVEKLGEILNANPQGVLVYRDELSGWLANLDKKGRESDRAFYLESWGGNSSFTYDRIGRGTIHIDTCCVSLFGTTQPGKLMAYLKQALTGVGNDGLIQRLQLMVYPDEKKDWELVDRTPDKEAKDKAFYIFENLDKADFTEFGGVKKEGEYATDFRFSPEAQRVFNSWLHDLEKLIRTEDEHPAISEHLAKYRSLMPSLALLIHLIDVAGGAKPGNVSEGAAIKAAAWTAYLEQHARRIYGLVIAGEVKAAKLLLNKIKAKKLKNGFKVRDVYRHGWTMLNTCEDAQAACELLCDYDWLIPAELPPGIKGGRLTTSYLINPKIYEAKT